MLNLRTVRYGYLGAILGMAAAIAACSQTPASLSPTSPAAVPDSLAVKPPVTGTVRYYKAGITPGTVAASAATAFTVTITNCGDSDCGTSVTSAHQLIRSAGITVPSGFTSVSLGAVTAAGGSKSWSANLSAGVVILGASQGNDGLEPGESVSVVVNATAPAQCAPYEWSTAAYQDSLSGGALVTTTAFSLVGGQPSVTVNGCSITTDCPAAPAIAVAYLHGRGIHSNDDVFNTIVNAVAQALADDHFGRNPCVAGYEANVIAFIESLDLLP